jgi:hypothetical protein
MPLSQSLFGLEIGTTKRSGTLVRLLVVAAMFSMPTGCGQDSNADRRDSAHDLAADPSEGAEAASTAGDGKVEEADLALVEVGSVEHGIEVESCEASDGGVADGGDDGTNEGGDADQIRSAGDAADACPSLDVEAERDLGQPNGRLDASWDSLQLDGAAIDSVADRAADVPVNKLVVDAADTQPDRPLYDSGSAFDGGAPIDGGDRRIWVYLLAGQSNMVGVGLDEQLSGDDAKTVPGVSIYARFASSANPNLGRWLSLAPGFGYLADRFGPELAFGRHMHELYPTRSLAIIKVAEGSTGLYDRWKASTGDLYQLLVKETRAQLQVLATQGRPQIAGLLWMQGETDATMVSPAKAYQQNLTQFIGSLRSDLGISRLPVVAGLIAKDAKWPYADIVRAATTEISTQLGRVDVVETDDLPMFPTDLAHLDSDSNLKLGRRFADAIAAMQSTRWQMSSGFGSAQGDGCWSYRERSDAGIALLSFDAVNARWTGSESNLSIGSGWMHPGATHQAELGWWAPFAGDIEVKIVAAVPSIYTQGVRLEVASATSSIWGPIGLQARSSDSFTFSRTVAQGDELYFRTSSGRSSAPPEDKTTWGIDITMSRVDE